MRNVNRLIADVLFEPAECDDILAALDGAGWRAGEVGRASTADQAQEPVTRVCDLRPVADGALLGRLGTYLFHLNANIYGFELRGFDERDPVSFMRYQPGGHFDWHQDIAAYDGPLASRKLSFTVQLSEPDDYAGGDLQFAMHWLTGQHDASAARMRARGTIVVFPALHYHRVTPITGGTRLALVGWVHGPPFV